ncbi:LOW QUALITY PROTEIN: SEC1 family transport protein SLY1 [Rosa chinensis]|uniref:LOW QUALITY PROTEIN: SEC1 family transport protein SLY1 n=1 Tax=Rosa chinensis TaxID=74649 RepID=UPI000D086A18|nr:LOW QUALITY PROTEIN: SEC1 family transport protein SLY1 [Rosa chinensis]
MTWHVLIGLSSCEPIKYKKDVDEVNRRTSGTDGTEFDGTDVIGNTKHLMSAVNSLPELTEKELRWINYVRFAIMYLISSESINHAKIKSLNVSLASANSASRSKQNVVDWGHEKLYGQSFSAVTAGFKNLLYSSDRQLALTRAVEALMEGKPNPEVDSYLMFDPRAPESSSGSNHLKGPFKEAIVLMVGGGNYVEYGSLQELVQRQQPTRHVIYGTTEILTGEECFVEQLAILGQKMGLGGAPVAAPTL